MNCYYSILHGSSPIVMNIPHAGQAFPGHDDWRDRIREIADLNIDSIGLPVRTNLDASLIISMMSRLWCDIERYPDEREEMNKVGMGVIYENDAQMHPLYDRPLTEEERKLRLSKLYYPYHKQLTRLCEDALQRHGKALLLDLHSYSTRPLPCELHQKDPRPEICIGHNNDPASLKVADKLTVNLLDAGYMVGVNQTFKGAITPNGLDDPNLACVMIEIRKDQYLKSPDGTIDMGKRQRLIDALTDSLKGIMS